MKKIFQHFLFLGFSLFFLVAPVFAQDEDTTEKEEIPSCQDLISPETGEDVQALRECIREKKKAIRQKHKKNKIQKSVERDRQLRESKLAPFCIFDPKKNLCDQIKRPQPNQ